MVHNCVKIEVFRDFLPMIYIDIFIIYIIFITYTLTAEKIEHGAQTVQNLSTRALGDIDDKNY